MTRTREESAMRGRGASWNPANRFDGCDYQQDEYIQELPDDHDTCGTTFLEDRTKNILAENDSPDVGFDVGINPYRGCEHGCVYCYARPTHEYLGFSAGLDFESKILVKHKAPELLREAFCAKKWKPQVVALSGNTDCYQPGERKFELTRRCLEVFLEFRNPVVIITKNRLVTRDLDLLSELAKHNLVSVNISVTTLDLGLNRALEPRSSSPAQRIEAVRMLAEAGVPTGVLIAPVVPCITDHEIPKIIEAVADAGARRASYVMLRLPHAVAPLFERWLEQHYPDRKEKVLNRVRAVRGGALYKSEFGTRMKGEGLFADQVKSLFQIACRKHRLNQERVELSTEHFRRPGVDQLTLF